MSKPIPIPDRPRIRTIQHKNRFTSAEVDPSKKVPPTPKSNHMQNAETNPIYPKAGAPTTRANGYVNLQSCPVTGVKPQTSGPTAGSPVVAREGSLAGSTSFSSPGRAGGRRVSAGLVPKGADKETLFNGGGSSYLKTKQQHPGRADPVEPPMYPIRASRDGTTSVSGIM